MSIFHFFEIDLKESTVIISNDNSITITHAGQTSTLEFRGGKITEIYVKKPGSGYCKPNYNNVIPLPTYYVTADRYTVYEGETINFTINTSNVEDGTILQYRLNGSVNSNDIDGGNTSGPISINQNKGLISIKTKPRTNDRKGTLPPNGGKKTISKTIQKLQKTTTQTLLTRT